jgi:hypothetical protein
LFFSEKLERLIKRVWRKGFFCRGEGKKREKEPGKLWQGEARKVSVREPYLGEASRDGKDYEPTNYVYMWEMGIKRWEWERVGEYDRQMLEYERAGKRI